MSIFPFWAILRGRLRDVAELPHTMPENPRAIPAFLTRTTDDRGPKEACRYSPRVTYTRPPFSLSPFCVLFPLLRRLRFTITFIVSTPAAKAMAK
jgi:hypothetical protein